MNVPAYVLKRILLMIPTLFGITLLSFLVINLAPGGPIEQKLQKLKFGSTTQKSSARNFGLQMRSRQGVSEEVMNALKKQYGFDKPVLTRYWIWIKSVATLEFGRSFTYGRPAMEVIRERFPVSLQFGVSSIILTYLISISLGLLMAYNENRVPDRLVSFSLIAASSIPSFMLAILLLVLFAGGSFWNFFPIGYLHSDNYHQLDFWGKVADRLHHFILPLFCHVLGGFATLALLCRNSLLEQIRQGYIRTARAKGLGERGIYLKHAFRNALIPLTTGIGGILGVFLSGSLLIETIFQLNGIGLLGYQSVISRDYNVIMALLFLSSMVMLLGNLLGDLIYRMVDPRIDFGSTG